jgi:hypothetical protein
MLPLYQIHVNSLCDGARNQSYSNSKLPRRFPERKGKMKGEERSCDDENVRGVSRTNEIQTLTSTICPTQPHASPIQKSFAIAGRNLTGEPPTQVNKSLRMKRLLQQKNNYDQRGNFRISFPPPGAGLRLTPCAFLPIFHQ